MPFGCTMKDGHITFDKSCLRAIFCLLTPSNCARMDFQNSLSRGLHPNVCLVRGREKFGKEEDGWEIGTSTLVSLHDSAIPLY